MKKLTYGLFLLGLIALFSAVATAQTLTIPYEGRLTAASGARLGQDTASIAFRIYDDPMAGTLLWGPEIHDAVSLDNGVFNVQLGMLLSLPSSIFNGSNLYLEMEVRGEVLSPRQPIGSVPYAYYALNGPGLSNTVNSNFFVSLNAGNIDYVIDSVDITLPASGYVEVTVGCYLNLFHTNGTGTSLYINVDKTRANGAFNVPGGQVFSISGLQPTSLFQMGATTTRFYSEAAGTHRYYFNTRYASGPSASTNIANSYIRAMYIPALYGTLSRPITERAFGGDAAFPSDGSQTLPKAGTQSSTETTKKAAVQTKQEQK